VVGQLGGRPDLPRDVGWPRWKGQGWLGFVGAIECDSLPSDHLDIALPGGGTLLFFYHDGDEVVGPWAPETQAGARVVYVPGGVPTSPRQAPSGVPTYRHVPLAAEPTITGPDWDHPALKAAVAQLSTHDRDFMNDPFNSDPFRQAFAEHVARPIHRVGGYAYPIQDAVEVETAQVVLGGQVDYTDPDLYEEARRWTLLAQIDSDDDAGMCWGDVGTLYWLIRPEDLHAHRFEQALFAWQCT
jgi:uncharacterized protein YwqG